jgi:hypothetical protein
MTIMTTMMTMSMKKNMTMTSTRSTTVTTTSRPSVATPASSMEHWQQRHFRAMNTHVETVVYREGADVTAGIEMLFRQAEQMMSRFLPDSELSRLNAADAPQVVSPALFAVIETALWAAQQSGGLYDPTILAALEAAGYDRSFEHVVTRNGFAWHAPADALDSQPRRQGGYAGIVLDARDRRRHQTGGGAPRPGRHRQRLDSGSRGGAVVGRGGVSGQRRRRPLRTWTAGARARLACDDRTSAAPHALDRPPVHRPRRVGDLDDDEAALDGRRAQPASPDRPTHRAARDHRRLVGHSGGAAHG